MDEFSFIEAIKQPFYRNQQIIRGIGDDAAVFREPYRDVVTAVDTFVEGVHFSRKTMEPFHVGYRILAANLSDMAAMGAEPISYLVAIVVPSSWSDNELKEVYRGLATIAKKYKVDLIGGDTVIGAQFVLTVTINGAVERGKARYRHQMQANDLIFVTGTLGDSAAGLSILLDNKRTNSVETSYLINRHRMPTPRVPFAREMARLRCVALNDISDGISSEANELAQASGLTVYLDENQIPISKALAQFPIGDQQMFKLSGGEDFELLGSIAPSEWDKLKEVAQKSATQLTQIGFVKDESERNGKVFIKSDGDYYRLLEPNGYVHRS
ncbi:thiamine-monophosphate kinase [Amphibacillus marinus]|uniref:Thiamine-monophosphate kinase n=1 Tax=Amphibacillus marinus TaxID=872970 RepID=A0A1H8KXT9_9BACI|nr:thiamine-phosphate kinase [Amphibacillus marinus]SEN97693.1 thiamine-monophosphate kinase [Amphibacillus marinus]